MPMDPIVQQMIKDAEEGGVINHRAHLTDPQIIEDMIKRSGLERRQHPRPGAVDRRKSSED